MKLLFLTIVFVLVTSTLTFAQSSSVQVKSFGKLSGVVFDEVKAVVPNAKIIIEGKGIKLEVKSNDEGYYEALLSEGKYKIWIPEENGWYASAKKKIYINSNKTVTHDFILKGIRQDADHP